MSFIEITITQDHENSRLDRFIHVTLPKLARAEIAKFIRKGEVKVNGKKAASNTHLQLQDVVKIPNILTKINDSKPKEGEERIRVAPAHLVADFKKWIVHEDANIIAINKPAGMATQGGTGIRYSIDDILTAIDKRYRLVHRLDRDTSGVLVIAKSLLVAKKLTELFRNRECCKVYVALCTGTFRKPEGEIHYPLSLQKHKGQELMMRDGQGQPCQTMYTTLQKMGKYTLVEASPRTGRKHQIRAHLSLIGCPIVGDVKYGGKEYKRMMLHSRSLNFQLNEEIYMIYADIPAAFSLQ